MSNKNIIPTGFNVLDEALYGGFHNGSLNIIAARPGMGKTTFAMQCAAGMSKNSDKKIYIMSLEMSAEQVKRKFSDISKIERIIVDDSAPITLSQMRKKLMGIPNVAAVIVDYIQLITANGSVKGDFANLTEDAQELKQLAKDLDVPIICTSQLSRQVDEREDYRPLLPDIESLRQNVDVILSLYREGYYDRTAADSTAEIAILKNNYGDCNVLSLYWDNYSPKFSESRLY